MNSDMNETGIRILPRTKWPGCPVSWDSLKTSKAGEATHSISKDDFSTAGMVKARSTPYYLGVLIVHDDGFLQVDDAIKR